MEDDEKDKKIEQLRKLLDNPTSRFSRDDKFLSTLQRRLLSTPITREKDSPHVVIFSKEMFKEEEEFTIKEREEEVVDGETLFVVEAEEIHGVPEFTEVKQEESKLEQMETKKEEEKPISPTEPLRKETSLGETIEELPEFIEVEEELPEWKPVEEEKLGKELEEELREEKKRETEEEKKERKTKPLRKRRRKTSTWEPLEEGKKKKVKERKDKDRKHKTVWEEEFEPFPDEEDIPEEEKEELTGEICRFKGYTLYRKEIILSSGDKKVVHFFSREKPEEGEPSPLPEGYEVKIDKRTGVPFIRKKTG